MDGKRQVVLAQYETKTDRGFVDLYVNAERVSLSGLDMGAGPKAVWGREDYEYWTDVKAAEYGKLIAALDPDLKGAEGDPAETLFRLLSQRYSGDLHAVEHLRDFCDKAGIEHEFWTWSTD